MIDVRAASDWTDIASLSPECVACLLDLIDDATLQRSLPADDPRQFIIHDMALQDQLFDRGLATKSMDVG